MKITSIILSGALSIAMQAISVRGHGYISSPRSRNWYAHEEGASFGAVDGKPPKEYCPHCLNINSGVCGISPSYDYDVWNDSAGNPMPWKVQATYTAGDVITVKSVLTAHHMGHMELRGCPLGRESDWDCFEKPGHTLLFVRDVAFDMPADPAHPGRGYYSRSQSIVYGEDSDYYEMEFKIPETLYGETVLLQWKYITANSCSPIGYKEYFAGQNSQGRVLPDDYWTPGLSSCAATLPRDGSRSAVDPEQFFNCAEVSIISPDPNAPRNPVPAPVEAPVPAPIAAPTSAPVPAPIAAPTSAPATAPVPAPILAPIQAPTSAPITPLSSDEGCCSQDFKTCITGWDCGTTESTCGSCSSADSYAWLEDGDITGSCMARWQGCTNDSSSCCPGLRCVNFNQWYSQCLP